LCQQKKSRKFAFIFLPSNNLNYFLTRTPYDEVKLYLKKNSLVSKGLTIFDVLQPTSIPIKQPLHIQVIDRYVLAKVWDDVRILKYLIKSLNFI
jgi:hypothetical protein